MTAPTFPSTHWITFEGNDRRLTFPFAAVVAASEMNQLSAFPIVHSRVPQEILEAPHFEAPGPGVFEASDFVCFA